MTGLKRYALSVHDALRARGLDVALRHPRPVVPQPLMRLGKRLGLDAEAFFRSYPVAVDASGATVCHLASQTLATALLFQRLPPTVVTVHDIIPYLTRGDPGMNTYRSVFDRLFDMLAMRGLRRAQRLIAISQYTRQCLVDALGIPDERIRVVHRAVDTDLFRPLPVPAAFREEHALPQGHRYVLYPVSYTHLTLPTILLV